MYRIPCSLCAWSYVGDTGRTIIDRVKEHRRAVRNLASSSEIAKFSWELLRRAERQSPLFQTYDQALKNTCGVTGIPLDVHVQVSVCEFSINSKDNSILGLFNSKV